MPIFEYQCSECNSKYEVLVRNISGEQEITCPECKSTKNKKLFSTFAASVPSSGSSSVSGCSDGSCGVPSYGGCSNGMCGLN